MDQIAPDPKPLDERHIRQISLSRYYMELAEQQSRVGQEPARFAAINMLHEAFETALICFVDALGAAVPNAAAIDKLVAGIEACMGTAIPFRHQLLRFNKIRVNAKHHLVAPDESDLKTYLNIIPDFVASVTQSVFGRPLHSISLAELIVDNDVRTFVQGALQALESDKRFDCLVLCRRALYMVFEKQYDITPFYSDDGGAYTMLDPRSMCRAPSYAKNRSYIDNQVKEPFELIVIDHGHLEGELVKDGIDIHSFWNLMRLTPRVYQRPNGDWINAFSTNYAGLDRADCAYVVDTLIRLLIQRQAKRGSWRMAKLSWLMVSVIPGSPFFSKASVAAPPIGSIPNDITAVSINDAVPSFEDGSWFYRFWLLDKGHSLSGYIKNTHVVGDPYEASFTSSSLG